MIGRIKARSVARALCDAEMWVGLFIVAAGVVWAGAVLPGLIAMALFWPIRWVALGRPSVRTPPDWPIAFLVLTLPVTLWATALPNVTQIQVTRLLTGIMLYYAIANWSRSTSRQRLLSLGLGAVGTLLAVGALLSVHWIVGSKLGFVPSSLYEQLPMLLSDPVHPNVMGGALALLLPGVAALLLFNWPGLGCRERVLLLVAASLMGGVLVLTKSRGGLLGVGAALVTLIALRWRLGWIVAATYVLGMGLAIQGLGLASAVDLIDTAQAFGGLDGRLAIWSRALDMISDFAYTGIGMGSFKQGATALYPFFLAEANAHISHAHNLFLQVGVDLGVPGLIAFLALLGLCIWMAASVYARGRRLARVQLGLQARAFWSLCLSLAAGLLGSYAALLVHGLVDAATWGTRPAVLVWALFGLTSSLWLQSHEKGDAVALPGSGTSPPRLGS